MTLLSVKFWGFCKPSMINMSPLVDVEQLSFEESCKIFELRDSGLSTLVESGTFEESFVVVESVVSETGCVLGNKSFWLDMCSCGVCCKIFVTSN